jgi:hypothetical protein
MGAGGRLRRTRAWRAFCALQGLAIVPALLAATASLAQAETAQAKFLRIMPEPTVDEKLGTPTIPMLVQYGKPTPINSFEEGCWGKATPWASDSVQAALKCMSSAIESKGYFKSEEFPKDDARIINLVGKQPVPMEIVDATKFGEATDENAGTAFLILLDASFNMGKRLPEAQDIAVQIINTLGEHDAVMVRVMDDQGVKTKTKWLPKSKASEALKIVKGAAMFPDSKKPNSLVSRVQKETLGSFTELINDEVDGGTTPMLQSVVLISSATDNTATGMAGSAEAQVLHEKLVKGDLGIEGLKLPVPVITIWTPSGDWTTQYGAQGQMRNAEFQYMQNLATPEVGGFFDIVQDGEAKGAKIAKMIRQRFDDLTLLQVKANCLEPSGEQSFKMMFEGAEKKVLPDQWSGITVAFDWTKWLLVVNKKTTEDAAAKKPLQPGESFSVFGDFCSSDAGSYEGYFVTESDAVEVKKASSDKTGKKAKDLLQSLASKGQKAETVSAGPTEVKFKVPNTPSLFENKPDFFNMSFVLLDTKALRVSARDQKGVLNLKAAKPPINKLLIVSAIGGGVVLILLIAILARSGGGGGRGKRGRRGGAPPAPAPMPGQPPGPPSPGAPLAFAGSAPIIAQIPASPPVAAPVRTAFAPASPAAPAPAPTAFAPPAPAMPAQAPTAFAPPSPLGPAQAPTAFAPPSPLGPAQAPTAFAPPSPLGPAQAPTAFAPLSPQTPSSAPIATAPPAPVFASGGHATATPAPAGARPPAQKGATSFPTTCPNPACRKAVMIPPGGTAQCAFCGTMVDEAGNAMSALPAAGNFGLTGHVPEDAARRAAQAASGPSALGMLGGTVALQAGGGMGAAAVRSISLVGAEGTFRVLPGIESRVGRDGSLCTIVLQEGRVSGVHASLKLEGGALMVRDDRSHNGTFVNGNRIAAGAWTPVPGGSQLRFGPVDFLVRHDP